MEKLINLLNIDGIDKYILKDIACTFIRHGKLEVDVETNSYISDDNVVNVELYESHYFHLSRNEYEPLLQFFRENGFSFSEIEDYIPDHIFYYVYI